MGYSGRGFFKPRPIYFFKKIVYYSYGENYGANLYIKKYKII